MDPLTKLESDLGISFENKEFLNLALMHKSYSSEQKFESYVNNERLEFLGDSVLSLAISTYLYKNFSTSHEGELSKLRSKLVSKENCYFWAKELGLGTYLKLGVGEEKSKGRQRISNLANVFEALIGAIYLDKGFQVAENFVLAKLENFKLESLDEDYKSKLQETLQTLFKLPPTYKIVRESGPAHKKTFKIQVEINKIVLGIGQENSKKKAEQLAAKDALLNGRYLDLCKETSDE